MQNVVAVRKWRQQAEILPSLVCGACDRLPPSFFADQPFWARRVHHLGVGTKPIPRRALTDPRLAQAITQAVSETTMRARAAALGERIRGEDGVGWAVEVMTRHFSEP